MSLEVAGGWRDRQPGRYMGSDAALRRAWKRDPAFQDGNGVAA